MSFYNYEFNGWIEVQDNAQTHYVFHIQCLWCLWMDHKMFKHKVSAGFIFCEALYVKGSLYALCYISLIPTVYTNCQMHFVRIRTMLYFVCHTLHAKHNGLWQIENNNMKFSSLYIPFKKSMELYTLFTATHLLTIPLCLIANTWMQLPTNLEINIAVAHSDHSYFF